jgi:ABC-2 type transport system ATP-binding protein
MRQKLGVVKAMLHRPRLLVLDEPTTGVDPVSRGDLWWLIARAAADGAAVILSTSYVDEAERAEQVVVMHEGRGLASGAPAAIAAAMTGRLYSLSRRPEGGAAGYAWRHGTHWRLWSPQGSPPPRGGAEEVVPELADAVIVASLKDGASGGRPAVTR